MSRNRQVVEATVEGVTVTKEFDEDRFALPAITYELSSTRTEPVRVRLVEKPPPSLEPEQFGFHSEYGSHNWRIDDGSLLFERRFGAGEDVTTVVGVRDAEDTRDLLDEVDEVVVTAADTNQDVESARDGTDESVADAIEDSRTEDAGRPPETPREPTSFDAQTGEHEMDDDTETIPGAGQEPSGDELADEKTDSRDARIRHLQADVADLRAYTAALEEFLDDHGSASEVVAEFDDRLDAFQDDLAALETRIETNDTAITSVAENVDEVRESVDDNDAELDEVLNRLESVEAQLEDVGELSTLADRLTSVEADVEDVNRWRENLRSALSAPGSGNDS